MLQNVVLLLLLLLVLFIVSEILNYYYYYYVRFYTKSQFGHIAIRIDHLSATLRQNHTSCHKQK
jgi:hypothetical protein